MFWLVSLYWCCCLLGIQRFVFFLSGFRLDGSAQTDFRGGEVEAPDGNVSAATARYTNSKTLGGHHPDFERGPP